MEYSEEDPLPEHIPQTPKIPRTTLPPRTPKNMKSASNFDFAQPIPIPKPLHRGSNSNFSVSPSRSCSVSGASSMVNTAAYRNSGLAGSSTANSAVLHGGAGGSGGRSPRASLPNIQILSGRRARAATASSLQMASKVSDMRTSDTTVEFTNHDQPSTATAAHVIMNMMHEERAQESQKQQFCSWTTSVFKNLHVPEFKEIGTSNKVITLSFTTIFLLNLSLLMLTGAISVDLLIWTITGTICSCALFLSFLCRMWSKNVDSKNLMLYFHLPALLISLHNCIFGFKLTIVPLDNHKEIGFAAFFLSSISCIMCIICFRLVSSLAIKLKYVRESEKEDVPSANDVPLEDLTLNVVNSPPRPNYILDADTKRMKKAVSIGVPLSDRSDGHISPTASPHRMMNKSQSMRSRYSGMAVIPESPHGSPIMPLHHTNLNSKEESESHKTTDIELSTQSQRNSNFSDDVDVDDSDSNHVHIRTPSLHLEQPMQEQSTEISHTTSQFRERETNTQELNHALINKTVASFYPQTWIMNIVFFVYIVVSWSPAEFQPMRHMASPIYLIVATFILEFNRVDIEVGGVTKRNIMSNTVVGLTLGIATGYKHDSGLGMVMFYFVTFISQLELSGVAAMKGDNANQDHKRPWLWLRIYIFIYCAMFAVTLFLLRFLVETHLSAHASEQKYFVDPSRTIVLIVIMIIGGMFLIQMRKRVLKEMAVRGDALEYVTETLNDHDIAFESPIGRATETIKELLSSGVIPSVVQTSLAQVLLDLQSGDVYQPDLTGLDPNMLAFGYASVAPELWRDEVEVGQIRRLRSVSDLNNIMKLNPSTPYHSLFHEPSMETHTGAGAGPSSQTHSNPNINDVDGVNVRVMSRSGSISVGSPFSTRRILKRSRSLSNPTKNSPTSPHYTNLIKAMASWNCSVHDLIPDYPSILSSCMVAAMLEHGLVKTFRFPFATLQAFCSMVESGYNPNPYHNSYHACDVLLTLNNFYRQGLIKKAHLSDLDVLCGIIAASVHDLGHPAVNNNYLIATQSDLALVYNDQSVLENFHLHSFFRMMKEEGMDILASLPKDDRRRAREMIIRMVLATDMANHFRFMGKFNAKLGGLKPATIHKDKILIMEIALKCADVGNQTKDANQASTWAACVITEFWMQGDMEKNFGLPISPGMDREAGKVASGQVGFIDYILKPLFTSWTKFMGNETPIYQLNAMRKFWSHTSEETCMQMIDKTCADLGIGDTAQPASTEGFIPTLYPANYSPPTPQRRQRTPSITDQDQDE